VLRRNMTTRRKIPGFRAASPHPARRCLQLIKCVYLDIPWGLCLCILAVFMDKLRLKTRSARNRVATGTGTGELHGPHQSLSPHENSSTHAVNEGFQPAEPAGTNAHDFGVPAGQPTQQPAVEPPTSLQSSIDAGEHVPKPTRRDDPASHVTYQYV
jgi:hypothetical protein